MRTSTEWLRWCSRVSGDMAPGLPCLRLVLLVTITPSTIPPVWSLGRGKCHMVLLELALGSILDFHCSYMNFRKKTSEKTQTHTWPVTVFHSSSRLSFVDLSLFHSLLSSPGQKIENDSLECA